MNDIIVNLFNHHINPKFILTPIAISVYKLENGLMIRVVFVFGIRVFRANILNK